MRLSHASGFFIFASCQCLSLLESVNVSLTQRYAVWHVVCTCDRSFLWFVNNNASVELGNITEEIEEYNLVR